MRAFDWKLPPSVLLNEPESLLSDVMTIEAEYQRLKDMLKNG